MPNQWAQSAINIYMDISMQLSNAKPIDTISYQCLHGKKNATINVKLMGTNFNSFVWNKDMVTLKWSLYIN